SDLAVRPLRPITFPRSSGWTRTSSTLPLRSLRDRTWTSSGCSTIPLTRCSSASSSTSGLALGLLRGVLGRLLAGLLGLAALVLAAGQDELLQHGLEGGLLGFLVLGLGDLERLARGGQALVLLPVAGELEDVLHRTGGLGPHGQPVLHPLGVHLDEARLLLRVVLADLLDRLSVALGARVGHDDPVLRRTDLPHTLELDLDSHWCGLSRLRRKHPGRNTAWGCGAAPGGTWARGVR